MSETAANTRWRPHRAGIRNVWEYDDQVFPFADGRMILRGPNGSGKSNALALLFPFLIDGNMSAAAMDPFAGGRSMRSLLLGVLRDDASTQRFRHDRRTGYVWLECTDGTSFCTIGCGARATADRGDTRSWFFVTDLRVGHDLDLAPGGDVRTAAKLAEVVGADAVFETAEAYRAGVDRALYGLGADRHHKLVQLIRVLRRPQLAGKLDLSMLSDVLASGLPALDGAVLDDVASSLDDLESTQRELADIQAALATVTAFLPVYATYLRGEAARRTNATLNADRQRRGAERRVTATRRTAAEVADELVAVEDARRVAAEARSAAEAERIAVIESPAYRDATSLIDIDAAATRAETGRGAAGARLEEAVAAVTRASDEADMARAEAVSLIRRAETALTELVDLADAGDLVWTLPTAEAADADRLASAATMAERSRRDDLRTVRAALRDRDGATRDHDRAATDAAAAARRAEDATARVRDAADALVDRRRELSVVVAEWAVDAPGLDAGGRAALVAAVESTDGEDGDDSRADRRLVDVYRELVRPARDRLVEALTGSRAEATRLRAELDDHRQERDRVAVEVDAGPDPQRWRAHDRSTQPGAPLWACVDFAEDVALDDRARLEAALDAAGLLDAWLGPDGPSPDALDAFLVADGTAAAPTLSSVLIPTVARDSGLGEADIVAVLDSVSLGRVGVAVDGDGHFVLGPLRGRATKAVPEFIGATARAERRDRRLELLDAQIADTARDLSSADDRSAELSTAIDSIDAAASTVPTDAAVRLAVSGLRTSQAQHSAAADAAADARQREADLAATLAVAERGLRTLAATRRLSPVDDDLTRTEQAIDAFSGAAMRAVSERRSAVAADVEAGRAQHRADEARRVHDLRQAEFDEASRQAAEQRSRADTLRARLGPDAEAPLVALARCTERLDALASEQQAIDDRRIELAGRQAAAGKDLESAQRDEGRARELVASMSARLGVLRRSEVLTVIVPTGEPQTDERPADERPADEPSDTPSEVPTDPLAFATWLQDLLAAPAPDDADHATHVRALDQAQKALLDDLHQGYDPAIVHDDDITIIEIASERGSFGVARLSDELRAQDAQLRQYLSDGDREVFERFLLNRVAHELRRLLSDADEFVTGVNKALADAPTASGLRVELGWEFAADDTAMREAVGLLRVDTEQMGDTDRATLRRFFERVIRDQRAERPTDGYRVALEAALDYRTWHEFRPYLRSADGARTRLTRARFRELSGGEQAVALHLPLFAAAAAHYDRADPKAPRLIALDEAFAGIDEAMRGELMGLTVTFDLDVLMTGHELWGAYAEVPAVAVHDLLRRPPAEGVSVFSLRWDGGSLTDLPAEPVAVAAVTDGLFASTDDVDGADGAQPENERAGG